MNSREALQILDSVGAVLTGGHFVYKEGNHGNAYVNKDAVYPHTAETSRLCHAIAEQFRREDIEAVVGPAIGGVILSQWTAYHLSQMTDIEVLATYAEKSESGDVFVIKRGYDKLLAGKRVLMVEDVLTTGGSAKKVAMAVREAGGNLIGLGVLCNRGGVMPENVGFVPITALTNIKLDSWGAADCPLCAQGVSINTEVGKGREFLARKSG